MAFENTYRGPCVIPCYRNLTHEAFAERLLNQEQRYQYEQSELRRRAAYAAEYNRTGFRPVQDLQGMQPARQTRILHDTTSGLHYVAD